MMALVIVSLCLLTLAGAVLHLAWRLALAALIWTPSAIGGIVAGWYVAQWLDNAACGIAATIGVAALVRWVMIRT